MGKPEFRPFLLIKNIGVVSVGLVFVVVGLVVLASFSQHVNSYLN